MDGNKSAVRPKELLSVGDGIFLTAGMIIGALIFKAPSTVAGATSGTAQFLLAWVLGAVVSLCGALVYAELASRHPDTGGEYAFLARGWGRGVAFVFAWARMTVIQTGAIAAVAFVFGEYASQIVPLGSASAAIWAAIGVTALTGLNLAREARECLFGGCPVGRRQWDTSLGVNVGAGFALVWESFAPFLGAKVELRDGTPWAFFLGTAVPFPGYE